MCAYNVICLQGVSCFAYSHSLEVVATGSLDHNVRLWTPFSPQQPVATLSGHTTGIVGVTIAEHSQLLFSLARDLVSLRHVPYIGLYDIVIETKIVHTLEGVKSNCNCMFIKIAPYNVSLLAFYSHYVCGT